MTAQEIVRLLGGDMAVSRHTGIGQTTISSWKRWNSIPEWRQSALLDMALALRLPLAATDFPLPEHRKVRPGIAA